MLIDDVPPMKREAAQIEAYMATLMNVPCSVKQYGKRFKATFEGTIG